MSVTKTLSNATAAIAGYVGAPTILAAQLPGPVGDAVAELIKGLSALAIAVLSRWIYSKLEKKGAPGAPIEPVPAPVTLPEPTTIFINDKNISDGSTQKNNQEKSSETSKAQNSETPG